MNPVTWVLSYDAELLEPIVLAYRAGDGARLVCELRGSDDGPEHGELVALMGHLARIAESSPAAVELPPELVAHVAELFAWAGADRATLEREGLEVDPEPDGAELVAEALREPLEGLEALRAGATLAGLVAEPGAVDAIGESVHELYRSVAAAMPAEPVADADEPAPGAGAGPGVSGDPSA